MKILSRRSVSAFSLEMRGNDSKKLFRLLACSFVLTLTVEAMAQTLTSVHTFTATSNNKATGTNIDGGFPQDGLIISGNTLYGTTAGGGSLGLGTVFRVNTDGSGYTNLHNFAGNGDGAEPFGGLVLSGQTLFDTTTAGGASNNGVVFKVNTDGSGFAVLYGFTNTGDGPWGDLVLSENSLYGTSPFGGASGRGFVFRVKIDGTESTNLYSFTAGGIDSNASITNSDGAHPYNGLVLSGSTLFGTTAYGGSFGNGTVFALSTDGSGFTNLHYFTATSFGPAGTNNDGAEPFGGLVLSVNTVYGTTSRGGSFGNGAVFSINIDGSGFTNLHSLSGNDGGLSESALILSGNALYGTTTSGGGSSAAGTVFALNTNGSGFTNLHSFSGGTDGASPFSGLVLSGNTLYGTASEGGSPGSGTLFSIAMPLPRLSIVPSGRGLILSWPKNFAGSDYTGYSLQSATNLASPVWITNLPAPVVVNGQNTVTNPISGTQQFFRLRQ